MRLLFSQRYRRAIDQTALVVEIPDTARRKIWAWLSANNTSLGIQRDPKDRWISNSSILEENRKRFAHRARLGAPSGHTLSDRHPISCGAASSHAGRPGLVRLRHHRDRVGLHGACRKGRAAPEGQSDIRTP